MRKKETITLGSGFPYIMEYTGTMPSIDDICVPGNLFGYVKGGAALTYTGEIYEEKDDLGRVSKIIVTNEDVKLKLGLLTWNLVTLNKLVATGRVTESGGRRTIKIGGIGNDNGKSYVVCFAHKDKADGNLWILIRGRNTAGFTLTLAKDAGSVIEPEFTALAQDDEGTLVQLTEEIGAAGVPHTVTLTDSDNGITGFEVSSDGVSWTDYSGPVTVNDGGNLYIKAKLAEGYTFTQWAAGITTNPFHILNITDNVSYTPTSQGVNT